MPQTIFYRGNAQLFEVMNRTLRDENLEITTINTTGEKFPNKKMASKKKRKIEKSNTIPKKAVHHSDQYYKIPFCIYGSFSQKLGIKNTELQWMRSCKDTLVFLLWNDDIYFPSQTLLIVGSLARSIQSKEKNRGQREGISVLELTEDGLLEGFVTDIELGDGFLLIQTREHTLYGLGDDTINQLGIATKNQNFHHEITEIPFEHGQIDFIRCGLTYSVAYTKSREIYISGEYDIVGRSLPWTLFTMFDKIVDDSRIVTDCQPGVLSMYFLTKPTSDILVHNSYVFDWYLGSIRGSGYFQELKDLLQQGLTILRIESNQDSLVIQLSDGEWYWVHFALTVHGSYREYFWNLKNSIPVEGDTQFSIINVCGNKSENKFLVAIQITSETNNYDKTLEPFMIFELDPHQVTKVTKLSCPFLGRAKWSIKNIQLTQDFSILVIDEEPNEIFMKRLTLCEKWRDVIIQFHTN